MNHRIHRTFVAGACLLTLLLTFPAAASSSAERVGPEPAAHSSAASLTNPTSRSERGEGVPPNITDRPEKATSRTRLRAQTQGLSPHETLQLRSALKLATQRLEKREECSRLFSDLGADGSHLLASALYRSASAVEEARICRPGVSMFTQVGGRQVTLCPGTVLRLERPALAALLLHEGLHLAGLEESPPVPTAPTSSEINRQVRKSCAL